MRGYFSCHGDLCLVFQCSTVISWFTKKKSVSMRIPESDKAIQDSWSISPSEIGLGSGECSYLAFWGQCSTRNRKNHSNRPSFRRDRRFGFTLIETLIAYDFTFYKSTFFGRKLTMWFSFKFKLKIGNDSDSFITLTIMWGSVGPLENDSHSWNIGWPLLTPLHSAALRSAPSLVVNQCPTRSNHFPMFPPSPHIIGTMWN